MIGKTTIAMALVLGSGLLTLVMAALLVVSAPSTSQALPLDEKRNPCGDAFQISIIPRLPTPNDAVTITYSAVWYDLPTPLHRSYEIADRVIRLDALYYVPQIVLPVLWPWGGEAGVGHLSTGTYRVDVYLTTVVTPTVFPPALCGTESFTVYGEKLNTYLPIVAR